MWSAAAVVIALIVAQFWLFTRSYPEETPRVLVVTSAFLVIDQWGAILSSLYC
jgi:hypothetical protein